MGYLAWLAVNTDMHRLNVSIAVIQVLILVYHSTMRDQLSQIMEREDKILKSKNLGLLAL